MPTPTTPNTDTFIVAGYDVEGEEIARWPIVATDAAEACTLAERAVPDTLDVEEYQAVERLITDAEIIAEHYRPVAGGECHNCGDSVPVRYTQHPQGDDSELHCLPCVHSGLAHGRRHVAESFVEELDPYCNYCGTTGHRASDCLERPEEN